MNSNYLYSPVNHLILKQPLNLRSLYSWFAGNGICFPCHHSLHLLVQGITDYFNFFSTEEKWMHTDKQLQRAEEEEGFISELEICILVLSVTPTAVLYPRLSDHKRQSRQ